MDTTNNLHKYLFKQIFKPIFLSALKYKTLAKYIAYILAYKIKFVWNTSIKYCDFHLTFLENFCCVLKKSYQWLLT